ncbi:type II secretion system F family protein [Candidatus Woesearchaeota archaeon]|nr:type II secretion system F family protein [Candidatus Woesearchaeota archaeon]
MIGFFYRYTLKKMPHLKDLLSRAGIYKTPKQFIKESLISSMIVTTFLMGMIIVLSLNLIQIKFTILLLIFLIILTISVWFFFSAPNVLILKKRKEIEQNIISISRQILIQVKSGVPVYEIMRYVSKQKNEVGKTFLEITNKVSLGIDIEDALIESIDMTPSENLQRLLDQILNGLSSGSELAPGLENLIEQMTDSAIVDIQKYGKKLNPIAMFYMMIAVIVPTLGVTMLVVVSSFLSLNLNLGMLILITVFITFVQFMFINVIKKGRPNINI